MNLSPLEHDATIELFNLAMGQAASALSQMVQEEVILSVPSLDLLPRSDAAAHLGCPADQRICVVRESFAGPFDGQALLIFPEQSSLDLVSRLLAEASAAMTELEEEALTEIGNVILNYCLASFGNLLGAEIRTELPRYQIGLPDAVIGGAASGPGDFVLVIRVDFRLATQSIHGYVLFVQDIASIQQFREALGSYLVANGL